MSRNKQIGKVGAQRTIWDAERKPATEIMKTVAAKAMDEKQMAKTLTAEEIKGVLARRDVGETTSQEEHNYFFQKIILRVKKTPSPNRNRIGGSVFSVLSGIRSREDDLPTVSVSV